MARQWKQEIDITSDKMPPRLQALLKNLKPFTRRYCEFRAKGLTQSEAAKKAGSKAKTRSILGRVGYNAEKQEGVKEYILWLEHKRAKANAIDDIEIIQKLRDVYDAAMAENKYKDANKALELLGNTIGMFKKGSNQTDTGDSQGIGKKIKNNVKAFTQDSDDLPLEKRIVNLQKLLKDNIK